MTTDRAPRRPGDWKAHAVMIPLALVSIFPVWWMFVTSLRSVSEIYIGLPWPAAPPLENYCYATGAIPVWTMLANTAMFSFLEQGMKEIPLMPAIHPCDSVEWG